MTIARRLGKNEPKHDPRTLRLATYLTAKPKAPATCDYLSAEGPQFGMMLNDTLGDCTCAAKGHGEQVWSKHGSGTEVTVSDQDVLAAYERLGYNPSDPSTDQGAVCLDSLNDWRTNGIGGHRIEAFAQVDHTDLDMVKFAIATFGFVYMGFALPVSAQEQKVWRRKWGADAAPGSWGGHCVIIPRYNAWRFTCITWGERKDMTKRFFREYADEAYVAISSEWLSAAGESPEGLNVDQLRADLALVTKH